MNVNEPHENYKTGWVKVFRSMRNHWIWEDPIKFQWWIDIILEVNHQPQKVNLGYNLYDCDRGQSIKSLLNWGKRWNVSKDKARNFLKLLEKDKMIIIENMSKTTRITVCNYDDYQGGLHDDTTQTKRKHNASTTLPHTNKNDNNDNNEKNEKEIPEYSAFLKHALEKEPRISKVHVKAKYESWVENNWHDGNNKPIKRWKAKLTSTIPYIQIDESVKVKPPTIRDGKQVYKYWFAGDPKELYLTEDEAKEYMEKYATYERNPREKYV